MIGGHDRLTEVAVEAVKLHCRCFLPRLWPPLTVGAHEKLAKVASQEVALHHGVGLSLCFKGAISAPATSFPQTEGVRPLESTVHLRAA